MTSKVKSKAKISDLYREKLKEKSKKLTSKMEEFYPFTKEHRTPTNEVRSVNHYKPLKPSKKIDLRIGAFDIETREWKDDSGSIHDARDLSNPESSFSFGSCMWIEDDEINQQVFFNRTEMAEFMLDKRFINYHWWGFASGRFDLIGLYHKDVLDEKKFRVLYREGSIIQMTYLGEPVKANGKVTYPHKVYFNDLRLITGMRLADLGKKLSLPKLESAKRDGGFAEVTQEDINYNLRDSEIVLVFVKQMVTLLHERFGAKMKFTIASIASTVFRTGYLADTFPQGFRVNEVDKHFRKSYYGGRVELYDRRMEEIDVMGFDVNSLYPYVMEKYEYPDPSTLRYYSKLPDKWEDMLGMVQCTVYVPEELKNGYPILPYRTDEGKLIFPVGIFKGAWNTPELLYAMQYGCRILDVDFAVLTSHKIRPFKRFVSDVYGMRMEAKKQGNKVYEMIYKIILNSSYGKFAQRVKHQEFGRVADKTKMNKKGNWFVISDDPMSEYGLWVEIGKDGKVIEEDSNQDVICWASTVTSYARMELHMRIMTAVNKGHRVIYSDTDSLFVEDTGIPPDEILETGNSLGMVKVEHWGRAKFFAPKFYTIHEKEGDFQLNKHKGISENFEWKRDRVYIHTGERVFRADSDEEYIDKRTQGSKHHGFTWDTFSGSFVKLSNISDFVRSKKPLGAVSVIDRSLSGKDEKREWIGSRGYAKVIDINKKPEPKEKKKYKLASASAAAASTAGGGSSGELVHDRLYMAKNIFSDFWGDTRTKFTEELFKGGEL